MKRVLFVDDEAQILKSIRRIFAGSAFEVICADSGAAALSVMAASPVDMIVSDMRMPAMDGIELLGIVKEAYPETIRFILSGYSDEEEIMSTLQSNIAKAYIFKPWDNSELIRVVTSNLEGAPALPGALIAYINNQSQLPTTCLSYERILSAIEENRGFDAISDEIVKDQAISAKVLQIVNSAYYGIKTGSVKKALTFLGIGDLQQLVMSAEMTDCLKDSTPVGVAADKLWSHAHMTSQLQEIIQATFLPKSGDTFEPAAGLLHKIGIVLLLNYYSNDYADILIKALGGSSLYLYQLEKQAYGFSHADVSAFLLKWWNIPAEIVEAAAHYMAPLGADVTNKRLCCLVHIAQHYAGRVLKISPFCALDIDAFGYLGIDRSAFEAQYEKLLQ